MIPSTRDSLWGGRLVLWQPARGHGYRFNLDPVLLAGFASPGAHALELGAGCGVLGLLLLALGKVARVTAVEVQPHLAELAWRNAQENGVADRYEIICADLRAATLPRVDRVLFNPPYFPLASTRASPDPGRDQARREHHGTLRDFAAVAIEHLLPQGTAAAVVPMPRAAELMAHWQSVGASLERRRDVVARHDAAPQHSLVQVGCAGRAAVVEAPLVLHVGSGRTFSDEVAAWVAGPPPTGPNPPAALPQQPAL